MPWLAGVAAGAGSIIGGALQYASNEDAIKAQQKAAQDATQLQRDMYNQTRADQAPWLAAGGRALGRLEDLATNNTPFDITADKGYKPVSGLTNPGQFNFSTTGPNADPSYTWRLNQGLNAVNSSAAARGGFFSGNTGQALMDYGQGSASQEYGNQFARYQTGLQDYMQQEQFNADQYNQTYNRMSQESEAAWNENASLAGVGQMAGKQMAVTGQNYASNAGNIALSQGNNAANYAINQGNIGAGLVTNLTNQFTSAWPDIYKQISTPTNGAGQQFYGPAY